MHITDASEFAKWFWPTFVVNNDLVFLEFVNWNTVYDLNIFHDRTEIEASLNHIHILDSFDHDAANDYEPYWDASHSHFKLACCIGRTFVNSWAHKLSLDYPDRRFRVYYTRDDNPIVRFHQIHEGEPPWLDREHSNLCTDEEAVFIVDVNGHHRDR